MPAVASYRWDTGDLEAARDHVPVFARARARLGDRFEWGAGALDDTFLLLFKTQPSVGRVEEVDRRVRMGQVLVWLLSQSPAVARLRYSTVRDLVGSAVAAAELAPRLEELLTALEPDGEELTLDTGEGEGNGEGETVRRLAELAEGKARESLDDLESAVGVLAEGEERQTRAAQAWGLEPAEMRRLPAAERLALAEKLNTHRVRQVTDLFGRLRTSMFAEQAELEGVGVELVDVEVGDELSRMLGSELLSMLCEELFFARVADGGLAQYAVQGPDRAGLGGVVLCVDGSGSMGVAHQGYTREVWATAFKLHLLQMARRERRPMHVIDFGGQGNLNYERFVDEAERTPARILEAGTAWFGGGTDFVGPLRKAMAVLADENDRHSDVVFVSDGECAVSPRACATYLRGARARGVRTWGVQLGRRPGGLRSFCDHIFTITDLTSGRELGALLNAVQSRA
jgi:uncharacterized protein with von Willebrand factor type A (vWA) domain